MSNNVTLPGTGAVVETLDTGSGIERQVVTISPRDLSGGDSIGALTEVAPATDVASSGLNGRLQRIAQRISALITALGSPFQAGGSIGNTAFGISGTLPAFAATPAVTGSGNFAVVPGSTEAAATGVTIGTAGVGYLGWLSSIAKLLSGSLAVTGTFWQTTQPVSLAVAPSTPVTNAGTFAVQASIAPSTTDVSVTPAVTASAYTAGFGIGGIMTFANILAATSFNGVLQSITAKFKGAAVTGSLEVAIFKSNPSNGAYADHAAPTWSAADMAGLVGIYTLTTANNKLGGMTIYNLDAIGKALAGASQSLFAVVIVDGTPTPASTSDFTLDLSVLPG